MHKWLEQISAKEDDCPYSQLARSRTEIIQEFHAAKAELEMTVAGRRYLAAKAALDAFEAGPPEDPAQYMRDVVIAHREWSKS